MLLPSTICDQCGQQSGDTILPVGLTSSLILTDLVNSPGSTTSVKMATANEVPTQEDETTRVNTLLHQIASQSHFEERYDVRATLDVGGMGHILRAYDRILRREVAIKMMRDSDEDGVTSPAVRGQFLKEARIGGRLLHPNVLPVFDLGVNQSGQIYFTMRLVDGASLQHSLDALDKGVLTRLITFPLHKIVGAFVRACHGIDYAHQNQIIHLDIKPQNILVSGFSEVFVIDWGLARVDEFDDTEQLIDLYRGHPSNENTTSRTFFNGPVVGTPAYMAPEQARGDSGSYNPSTDVFGLGGVLYFVLYGIPPNRGDSAFSKLRESMVAKQPGKLRQGILPRGLRIQAAHQEAIHALESICLRALELDQEKRYPDVEKLIIELDDWLNTSSGMLNANQ